MRWMKAAVLLAISSGLASCGANFTAVRAAAAFGARLGTQSDALASLPAACREAKVVTPGRNCDSVSATARSLHQVATVLQAYANALSDLANKNDVSISEKNLPGASDLKWMGSNASAVEGAVKGIVNVILQVWTAGYKEATLEDAIRQANPHVTVAASALSGAIKLELESLQSAHDALAMQADLFRADANKLATVGTAEAIRGQETAVTAAVTLNAIVADLEVKSQSLKDVEASAEAFGKSHQALFDKLGRLGKPDLLAEVTKIIQGAK